MAADPPWPLPRPGPHARPASSTSPRSGASSGSRGTPGRTSRGSARASTARASTTAHHRRPRLHPRCEPERRRRAASGLRARHRSAQDRGRPPAGRSPSSWRARPGAQPMASPDGSPRAPASPWAPTSSTTRPDPTTRWRTSLPSASSAVRPACWSCRPTDRAPWGPCSRPPAPAPSPMARRASGHGGRGGAVLRGRPAQAAGGGLEPAQPLLPRCADLQGTELPLGGAGGMVRPVRRRRHAGRGREAAQRASEPGPGRSHRAQRAGTSACRGGHARRPGPVQVLRREGSDALEQGGGRLGREGRTGRTGRIGVGLRPASRRPLRRRRTMRGWSAPRCAG